MRRGHRNAVWTSDVSGSCLMKRSKRCQVCWCFAFMPYLNGLMFGVWGYDTPLLMLCVLKFGFPLFHNTLSFFMCCKCKPLSGNCCGLHLEHIKRRVLSRAMPVCCVLNRVCGLLGFVWCVLKFGVWFGLCVEKTQRCLFSMLFIVCLICLCLHLPHQYFLLNCFFVQHVCLQGLWAVPPQNRGVHYGNRECAQGGVWCSCNPLQPRQNCYKQRAGTSPDLFCWTLVCKWQLWKWQGLPQLLSWSQNQGHSMQASSLPGLFSVSCCGQVE